jgi:hypothetical protein
MNWIDLRDRYGITQLILTKVVLKNGFDWQNIGSRIRNSG